MKQTYLQSPVRRQALIARLSKAGTQRLYRATVHAHFNVLEAIMPDIEDLIKQVPGTPLHAHLMNVLVQYRKLRLRLWPYFNQSEDYTADDCTALTALVEDCVTTIRQAEAPLVELLEQVQEHRCAS